MKSHGTYKKAGLSSNNNNNVVVGTGLGLQIIQGYDPEERRN
jgi:hypothetical protein